LAVVIHSRAKRQSTTRVANGMNINTKSDHADVEQNTI